MSDPTPLWNEMERAAADFQAIPDWARPVVTHENALVSTPRPAPAPVSDMIRALARIAAITRGHKLTDVRAEVARWRAVDRIYPPDTAEWWEATLRLRDIADAADREARA